jgi:membrane protein implicated in regulation of membrane protease activity
MSTLLSLYIGCTIFGVGVTIIDILGILGDLFHEGEAGSEGGDGIDHGDHGDAHDALSGDHGGDYDTHGADHGGDHDADIGGEVDLNTDHDGDAGDHAGESENVEQHGEKGSVASHEHYQERHYLLRLLSLVRSLVHFSFGFGPVGWFALATGRGVAGSLAWSVPVGAIAMIGGRLLRQIQRSELDSQLKIEDLIMERGEVLVSIGRGQMGKVRVRLEGTYAERFARARNPEETFPVGSKIRIVDVSDECVYVEEE